MKFRIVLAGVRNVAQFVEFMLNMHEARGLIQVFHDDGCISCLKSQQLGGRNRSNRSLSSS